MVCSLDVLTQGDVGVFLVNLVVGSRDIDIAIFCDLNVYFLHLLPTGGRDIDSVEIDQAQARDCGRCHERA